MKRVCFTLQLKKDRIQDYLTAHQVWPELEEAMSEAGLRNFLMFIRADGLLVGYFTAEDPEGSLRRLEQTEVSRRWEQGMAEYFELAEDSEEPKLYWLDHYYTLK